MTDSQRNRLASMFSLKSGLTFLQSLNVLDSICSTEGDDLLPQTPHNPESSPSSGDRGPLSFLGSNWQGILFAAVFCAACFYFFALAAPAPTHLDQGGPR